MTTKLIWDLETNGLIPEVDKIWCLVMQDIDTKEVYSYSDYDDKLPSLSEGLQKLLEADLIAGHNIIGYDLPVLKRLLGWTPRPSQTIWDTLIMSQLCMFQRTHRHGLKGWGEFFEYPKGDYNDWNNYNQEMLTYCIQDVPLNTLVYHRLSKEASIQIKAGPEFKPALILEHDVAIVNAYITANGWLVNMSIAKVIKRAVTLTFHVI